MFERFTEEARRALFFARFAVSEHGGRTLGDAHLLLGVVKADSKAISRFVEHDGAVQALAECVSARIADPELVSTSVEIPFDTLAKRVLDQAVQQADRLGHREVTPEHLLLALISEETSVAAICLRQVGVERRDIVDALSRDAGASR